MFNLRELGGYRAGDGRAVRRRALYRSDLLARLADVDLARFGELNMRTVVDLRRADEIDRDGRVPPLPGLDYRNVCLQATTWTAASVPDEEMAGFLTDRYGEIAEEAAESGAMGTVLRLLGEPTAAPAVFHCSAGKDRTGVIAALALALLGVPDATIGADYAATQGASERYLAWRTAHRPDLPPFQSAGTFAPAAAILDFLDRLRHRYGSVADYARHAGLTPTDQDNLRAWLLTDASDAEPAR